MSMRLRQNKHEENDADDSGDENDDDDDDDDDEEEEGYDKINAQDGKHCYNTLKPFENKCLVNTRIRFSDTSNSSIT